MTYSPFPLLLALLLQLQGTPRLCTKGGKLRLRIQHSGSGRVSYLKERFFFPSLRFLYLMCAFKVLLSEMVIKYLMSISVVGLQLDIQIT